MQYKPRIFYILLLVVCMLVTVYYYAIHPIYTELYNLQSVEKKLNTKLIKSRQYVAHIPKKLISKKLLKSETEYISDLLLLAQSSNLTLRSIAFLPSTINQSTLFQLIVQGDFCRFYNWLSALEQKAYPFLIGDFRIHSIETIPIFELQLILLRNTSYQYKKHNYFWQQNHSFCFTRQQVTHVDLKPDVAELNETPINQIKMMGYFKQAKRIVGLIALPSGAIVSIHEHMVIGKEQALILLIDHEHIELALPNQRHYVLNLSQGFNKES